MDPLSYATLALELIKLGQQALPLAEQALGALQQPDGPTQADWDALHATEVELRARLSAEPSSGA